MILLPKAQVLRGDLHTMAKRDDIFWLDVTAPGDPCSFALNDSGCGFGGEAARTKGATGPVSRLRQSLVR